MYTLIILLSTCISAEEIDFTYINEVRIYFTTFESVGIDSDRFRYVFYVYIEDCFFTGNFPDYAVMTPSSYMVQLKRNCFYKIKHSIDHTGTVFLGLSYGTLCYCSFLGISSTVTKNYCFISLLPHEVYNCNLTSNYINSFTAGDGVISYSIQRNNSFQEAEYFVTAPEKLDHVVVTHSSFQYIFTEIECGFLVVYCTFINNNAEFATPDIKAYNFTFLNCYVDNRKVIPIPFIFIDNLTSPLYLTNGMLNTYKCFAKIPMTIPKTYHWQVSFPTLNPASVTPYSHPQRASNDIPYSGYTLRVTSTKEPDPHLLNNVLLYTMLAFLASILAVVVVLLTLRRKSRPVSNTDENSDLGIFAVHTRKYEFPDEDSTMRCSRSEEEFFK